MCVLDKPVFPQNMHFPGGFRLFLFGGFATKDAKKTGAKETPAKGFHSVAYIRVSATKMDIAALRFGRKDRVQDLRRQPRRGGDVVELPTRQSDIHDAVSHIADLDSGEAIFEGSRVAAYAAAWAEIERTVAAINATMMRLAKPSGAIA